MIANKILRNIRLNEEKKNSSFMICLEVWTKRRVKERRVVGRRVKGNGYPPLYLDVFKIK